MTDVLALSYENFPFKDTEPVAPWMLEMQPYEIAIAARDDGFPCNNMKRPEEALLWRDYAIMEKCEWRDLHMGAVHFWKSFYAKWRMWIIAGRPQQ